MRQWLVHQVVWRRLYAQLRQSRALLLTAGERSESASRERTKLPMHEMRHHIAFGIVEGAGGVAPQRNKIEHRAQKSPFIALWQQTNVLRTEQGGQRKKGMRPQIYLASIGYRQTCHDSQQARFARTVRAQNAQHFAGLESQV